MSCPLCESQAGSEFFQENGFSLSRCGGCGLLYVADPPDRGHLQEMYDREEWLDVEGEVTRDDTSYQSHSPLLLALAGDALDRIAAAGARSGRLLDVGTGEGSFLEAAGGRGFEAEGVELSRSRVARARSKGLVVHAGDLLELGLPAASFDVVSARDVLSHVTRPLELMQEVRRLLRPGGVFFVQTGNKAELQTKHDGEALLDFWGLPAHLCFFGEPQLRLAFGRSGLELASLERIPYLDWQLEPRLLEQEEGRLRPIRMALARVAPLRYALREGYRRLWYRGRPEAEALWVTARAV